MLSWRNIQEGGFALASTDNRFLIRRVDTQRVGRWFFTYILEDFQEGATEERGTLQEARARAEERVSRWPTR